MVPFHLFPSPGDSCIIFNLLHVQPFLKLMFHLKTGLSGLARTSDSLSHFLFPELTGPSSDGEALYNHRRYPGTNFPLSRSSTILLDSNIILSYQKFSISLLSKGKPRVSYMNSPMFLIRGISWSQPNWCVTRSGTKGWTPKTNRHEIRMVWGHANDILCWKQIGPNNLIVSQLRDLSPSKPWSQLGLYF